MGVWKQKGPRQFSRAEKLAILKESRYPEIVTAEVLPCHQVGRDNIPPLGPRDVSGDSGGVRQQAARE